jgi:hypothetical protein
MVSSSLLHIPHLFINTIFFFFKLSSVRILPRAADQTKKATLGGALVHQMHFQGKWQLALEIISFQKKKKALEIISL